jgi:two-component system response regulator QseB
MRILLVEDNKVLGDGIKQGLIQDGHTVDWMMDGIAGENALENEQFDVCILDIGLPRKSGLEVLKSVRAKKIDIKIILLTALDKPEEKIAGLDAGADDYITKPFNSAELLARLRALQRRNTGNLQNIISHERFNISIDINSHVVIKNGQALNLPKKEFALLQKLLENTGKAIPKDMLEQSLYSWDDLVDSNALEVHIHNLRKKLGNDVIRTIRGVGYIIDK